MVLGGVTHQTQGLFPTIMRFCFLVICQGAVQITRRHVILVVGVVVVDSVFGLSRCTEVGNQGVQGDMHTQERGENGEEEQEKDCSYSFSSSISGSITRWRVTKFFSENRMS